LAGQSPCRQGGRVLERPEKPAGERPLGLQPCMRRARKS
jgi:hypothetical protein